MNANKKYMNLFCVFFDWCVLLTAMAAALLFPNVFTFIAAWIVVASRQHALLACLHEGVHNHILSNPKWNDRITNWFCARPFGLSFIGYKLHHLAHHRFLASPHDPDVMTRRDLAEWKFPQSRAAFIKFSIIEIFGLKAREAFQVFSSFNKAPLGHLIFSYLSFYCSLFVFGYVLTQNAWFGLIAVLLWVGPQYSLLAWFLRVRLIAEHFGPIATGKLSRDIKPHWWEGWLLGPWRTYMHHQHHERPEIPVWQLTPPKDDQYVSGYFGKNSLFASLLKA